MVPSPAPLSWCPKRAIVAKVILVIGVLTVSTTPLTQATTKSTRPARRKLAAVVKPAPTTRPSSRCSKIRIMPLGDSLTAFPDSYRGPLFRNLVSLRLDVDFVGSASWAPTIGGDADGEGHGGFTIGPDARLDDRGEKSNLFENLDRWIPAAKPQIILLTIGTNDIAGGGTWITEAPRKLTALIKKIRGLAPNAVLVVGDIPPSIYDPTSTNVNKGVNAAASAAGNADPHDRVLYGDTANRLLAAGFNAAKDTVDGVHFSLNGGELFAKAWQPGVEEALNLLPRSC